MCAPKTPLKRIQKSNNSHFDVQSLSSNKIYQVNVDTTSCNCSDFPHIYLCKHLVAIIHYFEGADLKPQPLSNADKVSEPVVSSSLVQ